MQVRKDLKGPFIGALSRDDAKARIEAERRVIEEMEDNGCLEYRYVSEEDSIVVETKLVHNFYFRPGESSVEVVDHDKRQRVGYVLLVRRG